MLDKLNNQQIFKKNSYLQVNSKLLYTSRNKYYSINTSIFDAKLIGSRTMDLLFSSQWLCYLSYRALVNKEIIAIKILNTYETEINLNIQQ